MAEFQPYGVKVYELTNFYEDSNANKKFLDAANIAGQYFASEKDITTIIKKTFKSAGSLMKMFKIGKITEEENSFKFSLQSKAEATGHALGLIVLFENTENGLYVKCAMPIPGKMIPENAVIDINIPKIMCFDDR